MELIANLLSLFYPKLCITCDNNLVKNEFLVCTHCRHQLPQTDFCNNANNSIELIFNGRVPIKAATSLLFFKKKGITQKLIHQLKYKGVQEVGVFFGKWMGEQLKESSRFNSLDGIIKVPLHKKRMKLRGYNQLDLFASQLSKELDIPIYNDVLIKLGESTSQTKKDRITRFDMINDSFRVQHKETIKGKHLLLIDDVLTTGATLEACANELLKASNVQISIATMVVSDHF